jgi:hypothetical protein
MVAAPSVGHECFEPGKMLGRLDAANGDSITIAALGIGDRELGERGLIADILPFKGLRASELPP